MHPLRDGHGLRELRWWQAYALARAFEHDDAGHLVWRTVLVSGPRQVGKSWLERVVCAWRIHAGAVFGGPQDVLHVAHKLQAAQEVWRPAARWAVGAYGKGCVRWANGEQQIELPDDGSRWLIQAATDGAGVAFSLSMALVDEAWMVARHVVDAAIAPTMVEAENPQLWLVSTAGTSQSDLMATYRAHALALDPPADDTSLLILEWSAPPDPDIDIDDPAVWRAASPHWSPKREAVIRDERGKVPEVDFRQQWLNQWVPTVSAPLIDSERWAASAWHGALPGGPLVFGVDIAPDREYAAIVTYVGGVVEVVDARPGNTAWVPGRLRGALRPLVAAGGGHRRVGPRRHRRRPATRRPRARAARGANGPPASGGVRPGVRLAGGGAHPGRAARATNRVGVGGAPPFLWAVVDIRPPVGRHLGRAPTGPNGSGVGI